LARSTDTTYIALEYDEPTTIWDILKFICQSADKDGTIGYEMRTEWDGKFSFFEKPYYGANYTLEEELQVENYIQNIERIRNKITIKGRDDKPYPVDADGQPYADSWTDLATPSNKSEFALDAAASQKVIRVPAGDGAQFAGDDWVYLNDLAGMEFIQIDSISAGTGPGGEDEITMKTDLANAYTTANEAILWEVYATTGGWGFTPYDATDFNVVAESTIVHTGSRSVEMNSTVNQSAYFAKLCFLSGDALNLNTHPKIFFKLYPASTAPVTVQVKLWSGDLHATNEIAVSQVIRNPSIDQWENIEIDCGVEYADQWNAVGSSFDWTDVRIIGILVTYAAVGTYTFYIDRMHLGGRRWGGGTDDATVDGFAENSASQTSYGIREYFEINNSFLSDAECEFRAQALLALYKSALVIIQAHSETVDWGDNHLMAGDTVRVDLDPISVTGLYRIDEIDIHCNMRSKTINADFILSNTPSRLADYLYKLQSKVVEVSRSRSSIRRRK